ncbi:MAG: glycosyltransferase family 2 protein [Candidatus Wallbacteria bacterium]|nr:glycosyltransferase family 2 protein [Candidatus Wallbacteria bacterium]
MTRCDMGTQPALVSIVVPVYYNEGSLPQLFERLREVTREQPWKAEFVFVDDGSKDGSFKRLAEFAGEEPRARVVKLSRNFGSFTAIVAGLSHAAGDCCVVISADLQDPPELIPKMVSLWESGNEVVLATRANRDDPWSQRLFSAIFYKLFRLLAMSDMPEGGFDFVLIDRKAVDVLTETREKNTSLVGLILWLGFDRAVITYDRQQREHGHSMWTLAKKLKYFVDSFIAFTLLPLRLSAMLGVLVAAAAFVYAGVVLAAYFLYEIPVRGWPSLMIVTLGLGGVQLITLGVLGEYLWRSLDETRRRPLYVVQKTVGVLPERVATASGPPR